MPRFKFTSVLKKKAGQQAVRHDCALNGFATASGNPVWRLAAIGGIFFSRLLVKNGYKVPAKSCFLFYFGVKPLDGPIRCTTLLHRSEFEDILGPLDQLLSFERLNDVVLDAHFDDLHDIFLARFGSKHNHGNVI